MNPSDMLRIVDSLHREKNIDKDLVFEAIESALMTAAKKHYGETAEVVVNIDRETGALSGTHNGEVLDPEEISGRIGAQTAKQVIIQKIREAERDSLLAEYGEQIGQLINGVVTRAEGGATIVSLGTMEAILPRSEQIPGESHHPNERVRAIVFEVKPQGSRVKVVLSRTRPQFVQRLFEQEIPEIADGVISVNAIAREPAHRSKVAVSSSDQRVDCVGACVGVRGNRIKNIVDELAGERIDIVRWSDDPETLIRAALQPAEVDQVLLCHMIGRAIVLVREDQLSLAIGRKGQNVRLASKLCGWDIEIMTNDELEQQIDRAVGGFSQIEGVTEELAQRLVEQGYLSYDDLSVIEPDDLMEMGGLTEEQVDAIVNQAEELALEAEHAADNERRRKREEAKIDAATAAHDAAEAAAKAAAAPAAEEAPAEEAAAPPIEEPPPAETTEEPPATE
jgi:N utilization substance protein A